MQTHKYVCAQTATTRDRGGAQCGQSVVAPALLQADMRTAAASITQLDAHITSQHSMHSAARHGTAPILRLTRDSPMKAFVSSC